MKQHFMLYWNAHMHVSSGSGSVRLQMSNSQP
ncbi:hypothetical protein HU200_058728 [Digitaria exilis]|uniref:Reelin domain-containing protein n=1 Tax=Digitaria exilis TaxID=1010633 RepID=A0A835ADE1_9POAL|nr:hypothetical protein HU200_058728 [Digitaria exilis]